MIEAVLSDMDGTLINTELANATAYCYAINKYGGIVDVNIFKEKYAGMSWKTFLPMILPDVGDTIYKEIAELKKSKYREFFQLTTIYTDVLDFLEHSKKFSPIGLVTTASFQAVQELIEHHGLVGFFDVIVSGDDVTHAKPHAEPYLTAATRLNVNIKNCIVLEDSKIGIDSAIAANANVFIVHHEN